MVFRWPVIALNALGNAALRLVGLQPTTEHDPVHSPQELRYLLAGTQQAGRLEPAEARIASRALVLAERTAASLMTPRTEVDAVPAGIGRHELLEFHADPTTPYHLSGLGPSARTILYCASGGRSALACDTLRELGYADVAHLDGGFRPGRPLAGRGGSRVELTGARQATAPAGRCVWSPMMSVQNRIATDDTRFRRRGVCWSFGPAGGHEEPPAQRSG